jgi:bile acid-coenzyme A ligase
LLADIPELGVQKRGPECWAVRHDDDVLTWAELADRARRRAHALAAAGVCEGDFVILALPNCNAVFELTHALWKLGATPMPVSPRLPKAEFMAIVEAAGARAVIAADSAIAAAVGALPADFGRDYHEAGPLPFKLSKHWKAMTSGGSTGRPKIIVDHLPGTLSPAAAVLRLPKNGVILNPAPLYHTFPFAVTHMAMGHACSVIGMPRFDAEQLLQLVARHSVEWLNLVPTMMNRIARLPDAARTRHDLSSLKMIWHTAAPVPPKLKEFWIEWLGPERIWEMYGGTEALGVTQLNGAEWLAHRGSVGRLVAGEIAIFDEDGAPLPPGEVGEIHMRGPQAGANTSYHYIGAESRRRKDGFESYGDFGWLDEDGYLYIADRRTDLILCGGANIFPAEVEAALMEHPCVDTAIVIGMPHDDLGAVPHAIIFPTPDAAPPDQNELRAFVAERLLHYKNPRSYEFTDQPLRDEAGKVRRSKLRAERIARGNLS